jgi:protein TonB
MSSDSVILMQLPWSSTDDDQWFKKILVVFLLAFLVVAIPIPFVALPELTRVEKEKVPPQLARIILERKELPAPIIEAPKIETKVVEEKNQEKLPDVKKPALPVTEKTLTKPDIHKTDSAATVRARTVAKQSGLLAVANEMNELTDTRAIDASVRAKVSQNKTGTEAARYDASVIASANAAVTTEKVDDAKIIGNVNKTDLQERKSDQQSTAATERHEKEKSSTTQGGGSGRAAEDITIVFNKNKSSLYSLYDRERRKNVGLKGRIVFQLTIAPSGKVTDVKIVSSDLKNPALEARIISRIKMFVFTSTSGEPTIVNYPVEFLP